jgi:hypothetical protein
MPIYMFETCILVSGVELVEVKSISCPHNQKLAIRNTSQNDTCGFQGNERFLRW